MSQREEKFEQMLSDIQNEYLEAERKMKQLRAEGKEKTATYRQLMGTKLMLDSFITKYRLYGLLD